MLKMDSTNMAFNGQSVIDEKNIAYMNASFDGKNLYFGLNVMDVPLFETYVVSVNEDFANFCEEVCSTIANITEEEDTTSEI